MYDLSILIPARNEEWLGRTIEDLLENIEGNTEIITVLDGYDTPVPDIPNDPRVTIIKNDSPKGQRAATNQACDRSKARYVMKTDAHCAFDKGFDRKLMEAVEGHDDWTIAPFMKNLHVFDWVCTNGHRRYQGISGVCAECGAPEHKEVVWKAKASPNSYSFCFDSTPHFQYFGEYSKRPEADPKKNNYITESMSLQGSCFMLTRDKYWELGICDEEFGSWGSQGIEVACKTWLSGGKVMILHTTWYAHLFRTQGGDFGFPYHNPGSGVAKAKNHARDLFFNNKWSKAKYPLSWLVERFWPVKGWTEEELIRLKEGKPSKGIIYYTDSELDKNNPKIAQDVRKLLVDTGLPIVSASLKKLDGFGVKNIHFPSLKRHYVTMSKQILAALEHSTADIIFFCEHDVLYHPSHFAFTPERKDTFYYNENVWMLRLEDGHALHFDVKQLSGLCAYRDILITHFKERLELLSSEYERLKSELEPELAERDFNRFVRHVGFEPMTHGRVKYKNTYNCEAYQSEYPNVDIKHGHNATGQRWKKEQFRNKQYTENWVETEGYSVPGWEDLEKML